MNIIKMTALGALAFTLTACATTTSPSTPKAEKPAASAQATTGTTFTASVAEANAAAVSALKQSGFDIKTNSEAMITGNRPRKIGALVGSGGEKITVKLTPVGTGQTMVDVKTKKTFVGIVGQKIWDEPVMTAIAAELN